MEITWHGANALTIKGKNATVKIDPEKLEDAANDVIIGTSEIEDYRGSKVFDWPGEYEIKGVPIINIQVFTAPKDNEKAEKTIISRFEVDDVKFCHLGNLGHEIAADLSDKIGDIDVLIVPVEGNLQMKKIQTIIDEIEPRAILPVNYTGLAAFLKEMSAGEVETVKVYKLNSANQFAEDKREYIVLEKS